MDEETQHVLYLFCFARAGAALDELARREELYGYSSDGVTALCGLAAIDQWSGPEAEQRMRDLRWLTPRVLRHEAVVEAALRASPVLPARLGTLFSSVGALERFLAAHHATIAGFLAQVEAQDEWAVKGSLDRARAGQWLASRLMESTTVGANDRGAESGGGASYLRERRARAAAARELNHWAAGALEAIVEELRRCAAGYCQRSPGAPSAAGAPQPIVNLAFLVPRDNLAAFRACLERATDEHRAAGLELEMSGPWPPYSFCPDLEMPP